MIPCVLICQFSHREMLEVALYSLVQGEVISTFGWPNVTKEEDFLPIILWVWCPVHLDQFYYWFVSVNLTLQSACFNTLVVNYLTSPRDYTLTVLKSNFFPVSSIKRTRVVIVVMHVTFPLPWSIGSSTRMFWICQPHPMLCTRWLGSLLGEGPREYFASKSALTLSTEYSFVLYYISIFSKFVWFNCMI